MQGLGAFYEMEVTCRGQVAPSTGYLLNIADIDRAVRTLAIPLVESGFANVPSGHPETVLASVLKAMSRDLPSLATVRWWLTPYHCLAMAVSAADRVLLSQQFEFAAAHRLHSPDLSDAENLAAYGKCSSPSGHGHNYRMEPAVSVVLGRGPRGLTLAGLERIVEEAVIRRFDHKNLNLDAADLFGARRVPSVEHIARVCHDLLAAPVAAAGARLERVTVWETEKTSCTYPAPG